MVRLPDAFLRAPFLLNYLIPVGLAGPMSRRCRTAAMARTGTRSVSTFTSPMQPRRALARHGALAGAESVCPWPSPATPRRSWRARIV